MPISRKSYKDFVFVEDNYSSSYVVVSVNINFDKPEIFFIHKFDCFNVYCFIYVVDILHVILKHSL